MVSSLICLSLVWSQIRRSETSFIRRHFIFDANHDPLIWAIPVLEGCVLYSSRMAGFTIKLGLPMVQMNTMFPILNKLRA